LKKAKSGEEARTDFLFAAHFFSKSWRMPTPGAKRGGEPDEKEDKRLALEEKGTAVSCGATGTVCNDGGSVHLCKIGCRWKGGYLFWDCTY